MPYRHFQTLLVTELEVSVARTMAEHVALSLAVPARLVRSRIEYRDLAGLPYDPPLPDIHHRNETLTGLGDLRAMTLLAARRGPWAIGGGAGVSAPTGGTEENPFELGHEGVEHQHHQFGTGTWDPLFMLGVSRDLGRWTVQGSGTARFVVYENRRGYRAGHRFGASLSAAREIAAGWHGVGGVNLYREEAERWNGHLEEEGNLGRTDWLLELGILRSFDSLGAFRLTGRVPLETRSTGEQVEHPFYLSLGWRR